MFYAINLQFIAHIHKQLIAYFSAKSNFYSKTSADVFAQSDDRGYGHLSASWRREHSLSWNDKVNAGAKTAKCTSGSQ
jgi:hypothetical protein